MKTTTVTCDACGRDLTSTSNCTGWRLALINDPIPVRSGIVTSRLDYPSITNSVYFCGIACAAKWMQDRFPTLFTSPVSETQRTPDAVAQPTSATPE